MVETIGVKPELLNKAYLPGVNLSSCDLTVLLAASKGNNRQWIPGQEIQISGYNEGSLPHGWSEIVSESYEVRREGKGGGNIILRPGRIDGNFCQLVNQFSLESLTPLIRLYLENYSAIDSLTLLPNTSLRGRNVYGVYPGKINGVIINVDRQAKKPEVQQLLNNLSFPWARSVLFCKLSRIDVEAFVSEFGDGNVITSSLRPCKFSDFLYDNGGRVYAVIGGGGEKKGNGLDVSGSKDVVKKRLNTLYSSATDYLVQEAKILIEKIGHGVGFEVVTAYPYVGYDPESQTVFSGLPVGSNYVLFNPRPRPDLNLNYSLHNGLLIGANPESPVAKIVGPLKISGTPLTRVADFGV